VELVNEAGRPITAEEAPEAFAEEAAKNEAESEKQPLTVVIVQGPNGRLSVQCNGSSRELLRMLHEAIDSSMAQIVTSSVLSRLMNASQEKARTAMEAARIDAAVRGR
jgi:hypothetical protein